MRDGIREREVVDACGDHRVTITDAPPGRVLVDIDRDALDRLVDAPREGHVPASECEARCGNAYRNGWRSGREDGLAQGYDRALDEVRKLAEAVAS